MRANLLTFMSDFGAHSGYAAAMKGVAAGLTEARMLDLSHDVDAFDIRQGAFLLYMAAPHFPKGTVHCCVVDPGVGTSRPALVVAAGDQYLVGPDNGLLLPAARRMGLQGVWRIENERHFRHPVSHTFHGRDVFAPVSAHLCNGTAPGEVGPPTKAWVELDFGRANVGGRRAAGEVICCDAFGTIVTNLTEADLRKIARVGDELDLTLGSRCERLRWVNTFGEAEGEELILDVGSHGFVEVAVNLGSAKARLGPSARAPVVIEPA